MAVYKCPHGSGWHLTKSDESPEIADIGIPLAAADGSWKFIGDSSGKGNADEKPALRKNSGKNQYAIPIKKIECKSERESIEISGKVMEVIANVNIEKTFGINLQNPFCASMVKNLAEGPVSQITIHVENVKHKRLDSYTILMSSGLFRSKKMKIGGGAAIKISGKIINKVHAWCAGE